MRMAFTSADVFPIKLLSACSYPVRGMRIEPRHLQLNLTNRCNLKCAFCSCANRDRDGEMSYTDASMLLTRFRVLGCRAVTVTGGGEPLLHPQINDIIDKARQLGISVGLVTNGLALDSLTNGWPSWVRISFSDDRAFNTAFVTTVERAVERIKTDWAISYVLTSKPNWDNLRNAVTMANLLGFTHVRIVSDLLDLDNVPTMDEAAKELGGEDHIVIYQGRKDFSPGHKNCWISLLKPVVDVDGTVYPCCGVQYAMEQPSGRYDPSMSMGHWDSFSDRTSKQVCFDGSKCVRCYYQCYNELLARMVSVPTHAEFV